MSASHAYLAVPSSLSFGSASTANLHHLTEVNMRDPTGTNPIIDAVMTKAFVPESGIANTFSPFLRRFREENRSNTVEFLAFLDSSRQLLSMRHVDVKLNEIQTHYWIPISDDQNSPMHNRLWKNTDEAYPLTASVMNRGHQLLSTESQALKFQFLHFALQLLESNFYKHSEHEFQVPSFVFLFLIFCQVSFFCSCLLTCWQCGTIRAAFLANRTCSTCLCVFYLLLNLPNTSTFFVTSMHWSY